MKIQSHRDLIVWQKAMDTAMRVFEVTKAFPAEERYSLTDQMRRASRSVPAQIAEAWRRRRYRAAFNINSVRLKEKRRRCKPTLKSLAAAII